MTVTDMYNAAAKDLKHEARQGRPFAAFLSSKSLVEKARNYPEDQASIKYFRKPRQAGYKGEIYGIVTFESKALANTFVRATSGGVFINPFIEIDPEQRNTDRALKAIHVWGVPHH